MIVWVVCSELVGELPSEAVVSWFAYLVDVSAGELVVGLVGCLVGRLVASELTILNTHAALQELVVRAAASRTPLFARYDAKGHGFWIHKGSRADAILHPQAVTIPVSGKQ